MGERKAVTFTFHAGEGEFKCGFIAGPNDLKELEVAMKGGGWYEYICADGKSRTIRISSVDYIDVQDAA